MEKHRIQNFKLYRENSKESIKRKRDEQETRKKAHMKISKANNL